MKNKVQLVTYVDRLGGSRIDELEALLLGPLKGLFGGVHLLPFFYPIDGADAGYDPIDHTVVDRKLGSWVDVKRLGNSFDLTADLIANHVSIKSPQFIDFFNRGFESSYADMFDLYSAVFPEGASPEELSAIHRTRPQDPFRDITLGDGTDVRLWTSFTAEQVDINVMSDEGWQYLCSILHRFAECGVKLVRLDAIGYAIKTAGTSCFMTRQTYAFIGKLSAKVRELGMESLLEIHSHYSHQLEIARHVDRVYDFCLPPLVLHTLFSGNPRALKEWLKVSPQNCVTVLDTHDGIGVADSEGLLTAKQIDSLTQRVHENSRGASVLASGEQSSNIDMHQLNCTFFDALARNGKDYLIARMVQFFCPGIPQVYYVGLLAGQNDIDLLKRTNVGRDINRHYYSKKEVNLAIEHPVVAALFQLIRFRNTCSAFNGTFRLVPTQEHELGMVWENGVNYARLLVDFSTRRYQIQWGSDSIHDSVTDVMKMSFDSGEILSTVHEASVRC